MDLADIYKTFHPDTKDKISLFHSSEHTFLSSPYILTMTKSEQIQIDLKQKKKTHHAFYLATMGLKLWYQKQQKSYKHKDIELSTEWKMDLGRI